MSFVIFASLLAEERKAKSHHFVMMSFVIFASLLVEEHKAKSHHSLSDTKACLGKVASYKKKPAWANIFSGAADGNRTRDLRLTKATLYRLSHSSIV